MLIARAFGNSISCCSRSPQLGKLDKQSSFLRYQQRFTKTDSTTKHQHKPKQPSTKTKSNSTATNTVKTELSTKEEAEAEALAFLAERGKALGTPLTLTERKLILKEAGFLQNKNTNKLRQSDWEKLVSRYNFTNQERLTLHDFIAKSHDGFLGQTLLQYVARCGSAFFALTGAHIAGSGGMHVFGSVMVGCVTALGGRTMNDLFVGNVPVTWVKNPSFLMLTSLSGLVGFFVWPLLEEMYGVEEGEDAKGGLKQQQQRQPGNNLDNEKIDKGQSGLIYTFESIALGALCVVGAQQGIVRSLHPLISSTLGVTIAFGGVFRDLLCRRDLSLGAATGCQSYAIASFSGAAVYVALRELHVWNCAGSTSKLLHGGIPIGFRIACGFGTAVAVRAMAWWNKPDGLLLTMEDSVLANKKRWEELCEGWR